MNRRAFLRAMDIEVARAARYHYPLCVLLMDVDHFKAINDGRGHAAGDQVLAAMGAMLGPALRKSDLCARWGGEEFVVGLTSTDVEGGRLVAERVRQAIERLDVPNGKGEKIPVTASVGLACILSGESTHALIDRADKAMYAAKVAGRNRLVVDEQGGAVLPASHQSEKPKERPGEGSPPRKGAWS
jgi:diguanylate cyclase (GGDEF)-like protein